MDFQALGTEMFETIIYVVLGVVMFGIAIKLMEIFTPFSIRKEIEEDQNVALGVIMGAIIIALALIIGAVLMSGASTVVVPQPAG